MNKKVLFAVLLFFFLACIKIFFYDSLWFDSAFSMEYIDTYSVKEMFLQPSDVHTPVYYVVLKFSQFFFSGVVFARLLSVFFGIGFFLILFKVLSKLYSEDFAGFVVLVMSVLSSFLYVFTEIRMYSLGLFIGVSAFYCLINFVKPNIFKDKYFLLFFLLSFLGVWVHYYFVFFVLMCFVYLWLFNRKVIVDSLKQFFLFGSIFWIPLLVYFYVQVSSIAGMWFDKVTFLHFFSSLYYAFFYSDVMSFSLFESVFGFLFVFFCLFMVFYYLLVLDEFKPYFKDLSVFFLLLGVVPQILGLLINNFFSVYHHRFFIFSLWGFLVVVLRSFYIWYYKSYKLRFLELAFPLIIILVVYKLLFFYSNAMTELVDVNSFILENDFCSEDYFVLHESPFSSVATQYYFRVNNCSLNNVLLTNLTVKQLGSAGGSVIPVDKIIRDLKFLPSNEGLYFRSDEMNLLSEWNCVLLQDLDGLSLFYCEKGDFYD